MTLNIPEGYIHRSELIERGWLGREINTYLTDVVKIDAPEGVSNKAYAATQIAEVESTNEAIQARIAAREAEIPRETHHLGVNEIILAADLKARGWTPAHITRLLGEEQAFGGWSIKRAEKAEATDTKLQERIAKFHKIQAAKAAEIEAAREAAKQAQESRRQAAEAAKRAAEKEAAKQRAAKLDELAKDAPIFRKHNGVWMVQGAGLKAGQVVEVQRANQPATKVRITKVYPDGYARFSNDLEPKPAMTLEEIARKRFGETARVVQAHPDYVIGDWLGVEADSQVIDGVLYEAIDVIRRNDIGAFVAMVPVKN